MPRRTRAPRRIEIGTGEPTYPVTAQDYYRRIYFEAIDLMMNAIAIDQRFDQPSFDTYAKMESLLIKTLNSQDKSEELKFMEKQYNDDVNISVLTTQMEILQVLLKNGYYFCFDGIIVKIKELANPEREMIKEVIMLCKLILVNPATSAAGERSFSTAQRLKTWLRSRMTPPPSSWLFYAHMRNINIGSLHTSSRCIHLSVVKY